MPAAKSPVAESSLPDVMLCPAGAEFDLMSPDERRLVSALPYRWVYEDIRASGGAKKARAALLRWVADDAARLRGGGAESTDRTARQVPCSLSRHRTARSGRSRPRARPARTGSRDGQSDEGEGDGEGPPPPGQASLAHSPSRSADGLS